MDEKAIRLEVRISTIEYLLAELFRKFYLVSGISIEDVQKAHADLLGHIRSMKMPTYDPVISDLTSAELEEAYARLLNMIEVSIQGRNS